MLQDLRYGLRLMGRRPGFAVVAVATLALGIGTTTAIFAVADRVMAVGASPYRMMASVLGDGLTQVACGLVLGIVLSLVTSRLLLGLLFGVSSLSPAPYLTVAALLILVSLAACLVPARRAMRIDPASALRAES